MIKIKVLDDRCIIIRNFVEGLLPDEEQFEEFPLEALPDIIPVLKLFTLDSLKRIDTLTVNDEVMSIIEKTEDNPFR